MVRWIFWLALGLVGYTYVGYAALVGLLANLLPHRTSKLDAAQPSAALNNEAVPAVTLIVPAYNEAVVIEAKVENCLHLDYPPERLHLLFARHVANDLLSLNVGNDQRPAVPTRTVRHLKVRTDQFQFAATVNDGLDLRSINKTGKDQRGSQRQETSGNA